MSVQHLWLVNSLTCSSMLACMPSSRPNMMSDAVCKMREHLSSCPPAKAAIACS